VGFFDTETCEDFIKKKEGFLTIREDTGAMRLVLPTHEAHIQRVPWERMRVGSHCGCDRRVDSRIKGFKDRLHKSADKWDIDVEGACAEIACSLFTGLDWECAVGKLKRGGDIGNWTQVRHSPNNRSDLIIRPGDSKMLRKPWVLVTGMDSWYLIHGWLWGYEAKEKKDGTVNSAAVVPTSEDRWGAFLDSKSPAWGVPQEHLHPMETLPTEPDHEVGEEVKVEDVS